MRTNEILARLLTKMEVFVGKWESLLAGPITGPRLENLRTELEELAADLIEDSLLIEPPKEGE